MPRPPLPIAVEPRAGRRRACSCARQLSLIAGWLLLGTVLILIGPSCSSQKNYKVLSFFFDGVPDPNAPAVAEGSDQASNGNAPKMLAIVHKPYAEGKCNECHEGDTSKFESFKKLSSDICLKCHPRVPDMYPVMHGPVSAGECLLCHNPHESSVKGMLNDDAPAVCMQCHLSEFLPQDEEHGDLKRSCLECHVAHGSDKHGLLLRTYSKNPVTTQPTTSPATTLPATTQSDGGVTP